MDFDEGPIDFFVESSADASEASSSDPGDNSDSGGVFGVFVLRITMAAGSTVIMSPGLSLTLALRS